MEGNEQPHASPFLHPSSSSSLLKDISNFKTPKRPSRIPEFTSPCPKFFTASKQTPRTSSYVRHRPRPSISARSKLKETATSLRLKAFQLEQSQSSHKAQIKKEQSLKSLAKSLTTWLNFLFQNPRSCGCDLTINGGENEEPVGLGKRDGGHRGGVVGVDATWRCPKRQRDLSWQGGIEVESKEESFSSSKNYVALRNSLKDVCSIDDLMQRMRIYLSLSCCKEVFDVMSHVVKSIDEGRLKMRSHCPIVTDVGMKEKAIRILMCYNPIWLRIGLHVIFGGDSLLPNGDINSEEEITFLKMVIEKQFFSHAGLAKVYAYNKKVEGLYRPGYYENLGNVILKRFLLLVLILDRTKCQSALPLKYGIDGVDGGSPPLFMVQSNIKSSCQMIHDFLTSEVMHGEGNIIAHLVILSYKVSYHQSPLVDYDFRVTDVFTDLQDGVRLCRAIQLLQNDSSILMKMVIPSDTRKKNLANCGIALKYLKHAGVKLCDEDGMVIMEEDVANGDKEFTISLLWSIFAHLQIPLLINNNILVEEILKTYGAEVDPSININPSSSPLELLLKWIQVVCQKYDCKIDGFSSLIDGKAIWCLLDYYFRKELCCFHCPKGHECRGEESIMSATDYTDAVHNFILSQKLITLLGNFPEVLQVSDILEHCGAISDRSVAVLLVFLSSQLTAKKTMDQLNFHKLLGCSCQSPERRHSSAGRHFVRPKALLDKENTEEDGTEDAARKFKAIKSWWQDMAERNSKFDAKPTTSILQCNSTGKLSIDVQRENAARIIQKCFRQSIGRRKFFKIINSVSYLQAVVRAWLLVKQKSALHKLGTISYERQSPSEKVARHVKLIVDRNHFVKLRRSVLLIQQAARIWMARRHQGGSTSTSNDVSNSELVNAATILQKYARGWIARSRYRIAQVEKTSLIQQVDGVCNLESEASITYQLSLDNLNSVSSLQNQHCAATKIQSHFRTWLLRSKFLNQKRAITKIQSEFQRLRCWRAFQQLRTAMRSAIIIQSHLCGWIARREARRHMYLIGVLQRHCRVWLIRRNFLFQRDAATRIQSAIRSLNCRRKFNGRKQAAIEIQRFVRMQITQNRLIGASHFRAVTASYCNSQISRGFFQSHELKIKLFSVLKLQQWWRSVLLFKLRTKSAIIIQSHVRGWIDRQRASKERQHIVMIQSHWKGYLVRKKSRGQLAGLRLRVQKSAKNVDDSMRMINKLKRALLELQDMKSISGILHTCTTLDFATGLSQICCEELVAAGAIDKLLNVIRSVTRSIPDQEVLKHALSTLCNLGRYPHLIEVLIDSNGSIETILWEFLRNKEEGYFIALELLKKICSNQKGLEAMHKLPGLLKRLHNLVEELANKKAALEKRNRRGAAVKEKPERRLREAVEIVKLMTKV